MARIAIALTEDFADWEPALLAAAARSYLGVEIVTASPDGQPVTSMGGFKVVPEAAYDALDADTIDALVISGGMSWEKGTAPDFSDLVHRFRTKGRVVAGICAAASALAGTGILNDVAHTGNSLASHQRYGAYHGAALYRDHPKAVSDKGIVTAPGNSPVSFATEVLKAVGLWDRKPKANYRYFPPSINRAQCVLLDERHFVSDYASCSRSRTRQRRAGPCASSTAMARRKSRLLM